MASPSLACCPHTSGMTLPPTQPFPVQNIFLPMEDEHDRKMSPTEAAAIRHQERNECQIGTTNGMFKTVVCNGMLSRPSKPRTDNDEGAYDNKADVLIQNRQNLSNEDVSAVLAVFVEESRLAEAREREERESIKLAQLLVASDIEESATHKRTSTSDDLAALVVALRAELEETTLQKKYEEESFRVACQLTKEELEASGHDLVSCNSCGGEDEKIDDYSICDIQCQACHFDIERRESLRELECGHHFHAFCINRYWLSMKQNNCPFCRSKVRQFRYH